MDAVVPPTVTTMSDLIQDLWGTVSRRKTCELPSEESTAMKKTLTLVDITCLGLASTLGTGVYVILGQVAREQAGPSVVLSYLYSAVATFLVGLCYSELGARFPRAGSAYVYTYATAGEALGFVVGWSLLLELALGAAVASKACVQYVDALTNHSLTTCFQEKGVSLPLTTLKALDRTLDLPASLLVVMVTALLAITVKALCVFNNFITSVSLLLLAALVLVGLFHADPGNWTRGLGFFPSGISGILSAASTCSYSFIGYEVMAVAAGEAKTHHGHILATAVHGTFVVGLLAAFPAAAALTLFVPYNHLAEQATFMHAFEATKLGNGFKYLVVGGAVGALFTSLTASLFALSRLTQRMADDGLLFRGLSRVGARTGAPWLATVISGLCVAAMAAILDQHTLVEVLGFGTLLASVSVIVAILVLRYGIQVATLAEKRVVSSDDNEACESLMEQPQFIARPPERSATGNVTLPNGNAELRETTELLSTGICDERSTDNFFESVDDSFIQDHLEWGTPPPEDDDSHGGDPTIFHQLRNYGSSNSHHQMAVEYINDAFSVSLLADHSDDSHKLMPSRSSSRVSAVLVVAMLTLMTLVAVVTLQRRKIPYWTEGIVFTSLALIVALVVLLLHQPKHSPRVRHKVPCIPALPVGALWLHVPLLVSLPVDAWIRGGVWIFMGLVIYALYGSHHSRERCTVNDSVRLQEKTELTNDFTEVNQDE